ncbi:MAG: histidine--tRNA ligase [Candidatus Thermoplasmatota archaeon]|nr:histidine--tRNA ligase [Candidatus Thermoplasmatota archaeon]MCL5731689.1 histidine--tRNA ligase [Candidatus Thermoplasmatota archaeon]
MIEKLKGFREFYPEDIRERNKIFRSAERISRVFGYEEISFPSLEPLDLFRIKSGEEIMRQTYSFTDKGGREVTLIPEATPSVSRMLAERKDIPRPVRWYSFQKFWRYEEPQSGRLREFYQYNADLFGSYSTVSDAEIIALAGSILNDLGLKGLYSIRVNHRGMMEKLLRQFGAEHPEKLLPVIDRYHKMERDDIEMEMEKAGLDSSRVRALEGILEKQVPLNGIRQFLSENGVEFTSIDEISWLEHVAELLSSYGINEAVFDASVVRGFNYYTGIVFEAFDIKGDNRAILGGGRYDNLTSVISGTEIPAVGFGMGDVVLELVMRSAGIWREENNDLRVSLCLTSVEFLKEVLPLMTEIRNSGISVLIPPEIKNLSSQMADAAKNRSRFAIIIGKKEIDGGEATVRDMISGEQYHVPFSTLKGWFLKKRSESDI